MTPEHKSVEAVAFTVHYADGTQSRVVKGLLSGPTSDGGVRVLSVGLDAAGYLTLLAGLEALVTHLLQDDTAQEV